MIVHCIYLFIYLFYQCVVVAECPGHCKRCVTDQDGSSGECLDQQCDTKYGVKAADKRCYGKPHLQSVLKPLICCHSGVLMKYVLTNQWFIIGVLVKTVLVVVRETVNQWVILVVRERQTNGLFLLSQNQLV